MPYKKCPCGHQPGFGLLGGKPTWCKDCKPDDAIDVVSKKCPCGKRPSFGLPGGKPMWCKDCKPVNAFDVKNKKCPCGKSQPVFGLPGDTRPTWCDKCPNKPKDVIDIVSTICPGYNGVPCPVRTQLMYGKSYCISCDPNDYVIATGKTTSVRDFVKMAFGVLNIVVEFSGENENEVAYVVSSPEASHVKVGDVVMKINKDFYRPAEVDLLVGDAAKAKNVLGWEPKTSLEELVRMMVLADVEQ
jgi:hypothetical protein